MFSWQVNAVQLKIEPYKSVLTNYLRLLTCVEKRIKHVIFIWKKKNFDACSNASNRGVVVRLTPVTHMAVCFSGLQSVVCQKRKKLDDLNKITVGNFT